MTPSLRWMDGRPDITEESTLEEVAAELQAMQGGLMVELTVSLSAGRWLARAEFNIADDGRPFDEEDVTEALGTGPTVGSAICALIRDMRTTR